MGQSRSFTTHRPVTGIAGLLGGLVLAGCVATTSVHEGHDGRGRANAGDVPANDFLLEITGTGALRLRVGCTPYTLKLVAWAHREEEELSVRPCAANVATELPIALDPMALAELDAQPIGYVETANGLRLLQTTLEVGNDDRPIQIPLEKWGIELATARGWMRFSMSEDALLSGTMSWKGTTRLVTTIEVTDVALSVAGQVGVLTYRNLPTASDREADPDQQPRECPPDDASKQTPDDDSALDAKEWMLSKLERLDALETDVEITLTPLDASGSEYAYEDVCRNASGGNASSGSGAETEHDKLYDTP